MEGDMKRFVLVTFLSFLALPANDLSAQMFGSLGGAEPGEDVVSVGVIFGQMNPTTRFRDGGGFDTATLLGGTVSFWFHRHMGVQVNALSTEHGTLGASDGRSSIVSGRDPRIWTIQSDLVVRLPLAAGAMTVSPYGAAGAGWKSYKWVFDPQGGPDARGFDGAWSFAGGVEARFGADSRIGLRGEFRQLHTSFTRFGEDLTHKDRVLTGALLINF
ncbi:MAG: porin family protein [Gammaproteobacteria bacterium]|nr:porin family protein [Gammaproteobacteria bacterium]MYC51432.1 porin family protein [Gammaproteobacteria bacterium]